MVKRPVTKQNLAQQPFSLPKSLSLDFRVFSGNRGPKKLMTSSKRTTSPSVRVGVVIVTPVPDLPAGSQLVDDVGKPSAECSKENPYLDPTSSGL